MAGVEQSGDRNDVSRSAEMNYTLQFILLVVCLDASSVAVSLLSKEDIIYSTKPGKPSNIHYIVTMEEKVKPKEITKLTSEYSENTESSKNGTDIEDLNKAYINKSGIITAPSRRSPEDGQVDCIGLKRKKDINGLCRKIWD